MISNQKINNVKPFNFVKGLNRCEEAPAKTEISIRNLRVVTLPPVATSLVWSEQRYPDGSISLSKLLHFHSEILGPGGEDPLPRGRGSPAPGDGDPRPPGTGIIDPGRP